MIDFNVFNSITPHLLTLYIVRRRNHGTKKTNIPHILLIYCPTLYSITPHILTLYIVRRNNHRTNKYTSYHFKITIYLIT